MANDSAVAYRKSINIYHTLVHVIREFILPADWMIQGHVTPRAFSR
ncbi:hypothetical protein PM8797T_08714 [Gimesia maris DSM 8797]|nr:hypothetical protein PM8797T_08714 [Gimesia maris DSM 8797]